jgi:ectoine hydroxylase-related dioxygenase (phytanoyl-CoA dioxygenase family)
MRRDIPEIVNVNDAELAPNPIQHTKGREMSTSAIESPRAVAEPLSDAELREYHGRGFIVRRGVFSAEETAEFAAETDRLVTERRDLIDPNNLRCRFMKHAESGDSQFEVFDPVLDVSLVAARFAHDRRILAMVESIHGEPSHVVKEKLIFKLPGSLGYNLHQDIPRHWEWFPRSFLTVLIAIDRATEENGCTEVFEGYHRDFLSAGPDWEHYMLPDEVVDPARRTKLLLEPGDVAIFHGMTPHRSEPNRSSSMRRGFYVSYNAHSDHGDCRDDHYARFHEMMRSRAAPEMAGTLYFK